MNRTLRFLLPLLVLAAQPAAAEGNDLAQLRDRIEQAQQRYTSTQGELSQGQGRLREAERLTAKVAGELRATRQRERRLAGSIAALDAERNKLDQQATQQAQALGRDMRDAWRLGRTPPLRLWLNADDPGRAARVARYYQYLQQDRAQRLARFAETRNQLAASRARLLAEQSQLAAVRQELAERERAARAASEQRRSAVAQLAGELKSQRNELARLRADEAALKRVLNSAREVFRDVAPEAVGAPFSKRKGKLRWPVTGRIRSGWGAPLADGKLKASGLLFAASEGSEVRAVHGGRVVYADWLRGYGLLAIIDHGEGFLTVYGHNQTLLSEVGDWVKEGEPIAAVGNSGGQAGAGLYFEVRVNGDPQDPARWLRR